MVVIIIISIICLLYSVIFFWLSAPLCLFFFFFSSCQYLCLFFPDLGHLCLFFCQYVFVYFFPDSHYLLVYFFYCQYLLVYFFTYLFFPVFSVPLCLIFSFFLTVNASLFNLIFFFFLPLRASLSNHIYFFSWLSGSVTRSRATSTSKSTLLAVTSASWNYIAVSIQKHSIYFVVDWYLLSLSSSLPILRAMKSTCLDFSAVYYLPLYLFPLLSIRKKKRWDPSVVMTQQFIDFYLPISGILWKSHEIHLYFLHWSVYWTFIHFRLGLF